MKRVISLLAAILLIISTVPISNVFASADDTKPVLESIHLDKKEVTAGETIKVSLKMTNAAEIRYLNIYYPSPVTNQNFTVRLDYNSDSGLFEGNIPITNNFETGSYHLEMLSIYEVSGNSFSYYNLDMFKDGDFIVSGTSGTDLFESIAGDKKEVKLGDTIKFSIKATGNYGIDYINLYYDTPVSDSRITVSMYYNSESNTYDGSLPILSNTESGSYTLNMLSTYGSGPHIALYRSKNNELFANGDFAVSGTSGEDILNSVNVDVKEATYGDTLNFSVKAQVPESVRYLNINFTTPVSQKSFSVGLNYNNETKLFEGNLPITDNFESGTYILFMLSIYNTGNTTALYQSYYGDKFESGNFTVFTEENPPSFTKLSINKKITEAGDHVNFTVDATDDTNLEEATVTYISPVSKSKVAVPLSYDNQHFTGQMAIDTNTELGSWKVDSIEIKDSNGNSTVVKAGETDLSSGDFNVQKSITPLSSYIVSTSEYWSYKTINSDVYIAPGATLTVNGGVTINGNIYVLGGLFSYGGLNITGGLYASSVNFFDYSYPSSNGQAVLNGSNSFSSMNVSTPILEDIPFALYESPLVSNNGKVNLTGATLPFVGVTINGQIVPLRSDGTFRLNDFYVGPSDTLSVKITDFSGYTYYHSYQVAEMYVDDFSKDSSAITGKTWPNSTVKLFEGNTLLGDTTSTDEGNFSIPVNNLAENSTLTLEVYTIENQLITSKQVKVKDITSPDKPVVNDVTDQDQSVSGFAEKDASVTVESNGAAIGSSTVGQNGQFLVTIPAQKAGTELEVRVTDAAGNVSDASTIVVKDVTSPAKPVVNEVTDKDTSVTGSAEAGAKVEVKVIGSVIGFATAGTDGKFSVSIPVQKAGVELVLTGTDKDGNVSESTTVVVKDVTSPAKPVVNEVTEKDTSVTGSAEAGAKVEVKVIGSVIGFATAGTDGKFSVSIPVQKASVELVLTATDKDGNVSESTTVVVKDVTSPAKPVVNDVTDKDTSVTGQAEAGSKVDVKVNGAVIGSATAGSDGKFSVTVPVQIAGTQLVITAIDKDGNVSEETKVVVSKAKLSGWVEENGTWFFYDKTTGNKKTGWFLEGSTWYYFDTTGAMKTGWLLDGFTWYFLKDSGAMQTGWLLDGSTWYYFNGSGSMKTGWLLNGSTWYFFNNSGSMKTGWLQSGATWYYFKGSGAMKTGWLLDGSTWYYFNGSGAMKTGWLQSGSTWYYFKSSGDMQTGWAQISGKWYYFNQSGALK
ncbi:Ig-like domain-containing protein [Neobacillus sp. NPDC097160]|uniref:Ig-like domain-containing protein n=1 Tax=Neobacillus sp. NPDC097160 TaxID=3364298 RepID=UPI0037FA3C0D